MNNTITHDIMRNENMLAVLRCIQENGQIYRRDIKAITGLSWGSISTIVNDLLERGVIRETKNSNSVKGRNPSVIDICTENTCIIGVDINIAGITVVQMDLKCHLIFSINEEIANKGKDRILEQIFNLVDSIFSKSGKESRKVVGIGIAMQGFVDCEKGIARYSPYFTQWENVPLKEMFEERYRRPAFVDHSPNCMALFETWIGVAKGVSNLFFIRLGMSIGSSIIIDNRILNGADGNAGEFGHVTMKPDGEECSCGNRGCLETLSSGRSILNQAVKRIKNGEKSVITELIGQKPLESIDMETVYRAFHMGDRLCIDILDGMALYLGIAISNAINILNPELVVIGGNMAQYESLFISRVKDIVEKRTWKFSKKSILVSTNKNNTAAIGAGLKIVRKVFDGSIGMA